MLPAHARSHALYHNRTKQHFKPPGTPAKVKAASADERECSICANEKTPAEPVEASRYPLGVGSKSGNNLLFSGRSERAVRGEPTVTVERLSCRHIGVLTGASLSRLAIMPDTPIATFVKRLRCSKCGSRSVLATRKPPARPQWSS